MKKSKKLILAFLSLFSLLCSTSYGNMTLEAMEESKQFYDEHEFLIESTNIIAWLMRFSFIIFVIAVPMIIIYKKIKNKENKDIIEKLCVAEFLCIINLFITIGLTTLVRGSGSESLLKVNIINLIISLLNIVIILFMFLKKRKI